MYYYPGIVNAASVHTTSEVEARRCDMAGVEATKPEAHQRRLHKIFRENQCLVTRKLKV